MNSLFVVLGSVVLLAPLPAIAAVKIDRPGEDIKDKIEVPAKSGGTISIGTLLAEGSIALGPDCEDIDINIGPNNKDLEGLITIANGCKGITIDIHDSYDTTGKVVVGDNCKVRINCGSDFYGTLVVGKNSKVTVKYVSSSEGSKVTKGEGSEVAVQKK